MNAKKLKSAKLMPVYMMYPSLYSLLMFNYWVRAKISIAGLMLSTVDIKHHGEKMPFSRESFYFLRKSGLRYSLYVLFISKLGVRIVKLWNSLRKIMGREIKLKVFEDIARENNIPVFYSGDFNSKESLDFIKCAKANIIVSACNNQLLNSKTINFPRFKTINIHPSYLPDCRGLDPVFEALYYGVKNTGATIHYVDEKIDHGKIIMQKVVNVSDNDALFSLNVKLWMHGAKMLKKVFNMVENGKVMPQRQRISTAIYPYQSYPSKAMVSEFLVQGGRIMRIRDLTEVLSSAF